MSAMLVLFAMAGLPHAHADIALPSDVNGKAPEYLARLIEEADAVEFSKHGGETTIVTEPEWQRRIAAEVRAAHYRSRSPCLCLSFPEIRFMKRGKSVLFLSFHHEARLRVGSAEVSGDFEVGKDASRWIWTIVAERMPPDASKLKRRDRRLPEPTVAPAIQPVLPESQKPAFPSPELPKAE